MSPLTLIEPDQAVSRTVHEDEYGKTLLTSFTVLAPHTLTGLSDDELQRYIDGVSQRMEAAHAEWLKSDCFDALGERDRLWLALQAALCERGTRPHLVAARIAEIDAAIEASAGAERHAVSRTVTEG